MDHIRPKKRRRDENPALLVQPKKDEQYGKLVNTSTSASPRAAKTQEYENLSSYQKALSDFQSLPVDPEIPKSLHNLAISNLQVP